MSTQPADEPKHPPLTTGNYRIGYDPNDPPNIQRIRRAAADLIDAIEEGTRVPMVSGPGPVSHQGEVMRGKAHAMTLVNDACMNAVRAATIQPPAGKIGKP